MTATADLAEEILRTGREAGLDQMGICDAGPFEETRRHLEERKRAGLSAGMAFTYRNPARSTDPSAALAGARALIVGAVGYARRPPALLPAGRAESRPGPGDRESYERRNSGVDTTLDRGGGGGGADSAVGETAGAMAGATAGEMAGAGGGSGPGAGEAAGTPARPLARVARYAWTDSYLPLRQALGAVASRLRQEGWKALVFVDDNSMVDRAAAVRAGIGWYGKNANVLLPGRGSWFVLGSVVTDAPLAPAEPPEPVPDGCGSCRRCMRDCPTGALVEPGRLDARRCLAWLVQSPGVFPAEYREALGDRLYGCDECQERCPVNRQAARLGPIRAAGPDARPTLDALEILTGDDRTVEALVGRWYVPDRQMRYIRRNALLVLGNVGRPGDRQVAEAVGRAARDPDPLIRGHAVWAAGRLGLGDVVSRAARDPDPYVREEARDAAGAGSIPPVPPVPLGSRRTKARR